MLFPDYTQFAELAKNATLVPVAKTVAADLRTPVSAFLSIAAEEENAFLLESVEGGEKIGRYTFLGARPYMILRARGPEITLERDARSGQKPQRIQGSVFQVLDRLLREHNPAQLPGLPPFTAGAVGFFSHDAVRQLERLPELAKDDLHLPDCVLMFFDRLLAFDHVRHEIYIIATADVRRHSPRQAYALALRDIARIEKQLNTPLVAKHLRPARPRPKGKLKTTISVTKSRFLRTVEKIKDYIMAGDVFQAVPSLRLELEPGVPPLEVYRALRRVNPSPYMYFLRMGEMTVLGSSPEMLVRVTGRKLEYRPIAGTRKRGRSEAEDLHLENELRADEKERAEHVMLVDLGRNDVGRVSDFGSVKVSNLMFVERYSHVMHLVSSLEGRLRSDLSPVDAFAACFPAGTLTGAPKVRAMEIIEEVEPVRRGIYGGSVLYADFAGNLDSCIAIRTMLVKGRKAYVQAGAGIVADSVPESEYQECLNKAQALVRAVELARSGE